MEAQMGRTGAGFQFRQLWRSSIFRNLTDRIAAAAYFQRRKVRLNRLGPAAHIMKFHGYPDKGLTIEDIVSEDLGVVTLVATPEELRRMSVFLSTCAEEIERLGPVFDPVHLADRMKEFRQSPHFFVTKPEEPDPKAYALKLQGGNRP